MIQSIIFDKKYFTPLMVKKWLKKYKITPLKQIHEIKNSYRVRIHNPLKNCRYYTKRIRPGVNMVLMEVNGGSFLGEIKKYYQRFLLALKGTRTNLKPSVRELLKKIGDIQIISLDIIRTPLKAGVKMLLDTFNKLGNLRDISHDKLFHLFIVITLDNGEKYVLEKNEDINIKKYEPSQLDEGMHIENINKELTINILLGKTLEKVGEKRFYHYDAFSTNCQVFVLDVLKSNNIPFSEHLYHFILQNVSAMVPPWAEKVSSFFTDLANRGKIILQGEGFYRGKLPPMRKTY
jgi:hypothetical protein